MTDRTLQLCVGTTLGGRYTPLVNRSFLWFGCGASSGRSAEPLLIAVSCLTSYRSWSSG